MPKPGFTLVEILITLVLISAITVVLFASAGALTTSRNSNLAEIASKIAVRQTETLRKTAYSSLPSCQTPCAISDSDLAKLPGATATQTITAYLTSADIKFVTVQVNWNQSGAPKELKMETLIYKDGI